MSTAENQMVAVCLSINGNVHIRFYAINEENHLVAKGNFVIQEKTHHDFKWRKGKNDFICTCQNHYLTFNWSGGEFDMAEAPKPMGAVDVLLDNIVHADGNDIKSKTLSLQDHPEDLVTVLGTTPTPMPDHSSLAVAAADNILFVHINREE